MNHDAIVASSEEMMMSTMNMTRANFEETVENNDIVVIDFWAQWCGPCRGFAPVFERAAEANQDIAFAKVDTDAQPELAGMFQIRSIPTLVVFREQIPIFAQPGALPASALDDLLKEVRGLDMEEVRREYEAHVKANEQDRA